MARRLVDADVERGSAVEVVVDGERLRAYARESLAVAAWCDGVRVLSRSLKYHRPRGAFCLEGHCSGCLMRVDGIPNVRTCLEPCRDGAVATSQNALPSAQLDALGIVDFIFGKKLDHHTLMTAATPLNRVANKVVRQLSGLGTLPDVARAAPPVEDHATDVCVVGAGPAGLAAAAACARAGLAVLLIDDQPGPGGSLRASADGAAQIARLLGELDEDGVVRRAHATATGWFAEVGALLVAQPDAAMRVTARAWIWATGGYPSNLPIIDNDRPGVLAARAVARLLHAHGIVVGDRVAIVADATAGCRAEADALATALRSAGAAATVAAATDVERVLGGAVAEGVALRNGDVIDADAVAIVALPAPASEGPRQHGCAVTFDPARGGYRVIVDGDGQTSRAGVWACGDVSGYLGPVLARAHGAVVGAAVTRSLGRGGGDDAP